MTAALRTGVRVLRGAAFVAGIVCGLALSMIMTSFGGGGNDAVLVLGGYVSLVLVAAAPVCWYLATHHRFGDRWTMAYVGVWVVLIGVLSLFP